MIKAAESIFLHVLTTFYQAFWFSFLAAFLFMFLYLFAEKNGWKESFRIWGRRFRDTASFRRAFFLALITVMILMRTLLNRDMWMNPLSNIMGGWTIKDANGNYTTDSIENIIMMVPFTALLLWTFQKQLCRKKGPVPLTLAGLKYGFLFSITIETLQLLLRLGTFQFADLFYNTLGGGIGGLGFWILRKLFHKKRRK